MGSLASSMLQMADCLADFLWLRARQQGIYAGKLQGGDRRRLTGGGTFTVAESGIDASFASVNNGSARQGGTIVWAQRDELIGIFKGNVRAD